MFTKCLIHLLNIEEKFDDSEKGTVNIRNKKNNTNPDTLPYQMNHKTTFLEINLCN